MQNIKKRIADKIAQGVKGINPDAEINAADVVGML